MPTIKELEDALAQARAEQQPNVNSAPQVEQAGKALGEPQSDPYAATAWGATEYDFITPLGQRCRLRNLPLEEIASAGILDKITRLPGLTEEVITRAQGQPPTTEGLDLAKLADDGTIQTLTDVVNTLVPLVVVAPVVHPLPSAEDPERKAGLIYVDSIDLRDRIAIMNRAIGPLTKLDSFRN